MSDTSVRTSLRNFFGAKSSPTQPLTEPIKNAVGSAKLYRDFTWDLKTTKSLMGQYIEAHPGDSIASPKTLRSYTPLPLIVTLGDETSESARQFAKMVAYEIPLLQLNRATYHSKMHGLLESWATYYFPTKQLVSPWLGRYDLCYKRPHVEIRPKRMKEHVVNAYKTGAPIEIGYSLTASRFRRYDDRLAPRHMNVHSVSEDWFRAVNEHGFRTYRFDRLRWARMTGKKSQAVATSTIRIESTSTPLSITGFSMGHPPLSFTTQITLDGKVVR
jgi:hypothetical protein